MSKRSVEILLGKLVTDEAIRQRFRVDPKYWILLGIQSVLIAFFVREFAAEANKR